MTTIQDPSAKHLKREISELRNENLYLKEQLDWFKRQVFGKSSEKVVPKSENQLEFDGFGNFQEKKEEEGKKVAAHTRRKANKNGKDKITISDDIPVEPEVIDVSEDQKVCPETGKSLVKIGEEITHKLMFKPGSYFIKKIIRPKYALPNGAGIVVAPLPDSLLTRCFADESFLASILVKKYCDHLPLYRQSEILSREGITITRQVLNKWVLRAGMALKPLYELMRKLILKSGNIFVDETPVKLLDPGRKKVKDSYVWVLAGGKCNDPPYRIYQFYEDRKHRNAEKLLKGYKGLLHSDKYGAYEALANAKQFTWCPCIGAHARRKFVEAQSGGVEFRDWILSRFQDIYDCEKRAWNATPEERLLIRKNEEEPILDEMIKAVKAKLLDGKVLPKSKMKTALGYFNSLTPYLKNYINDPLAHFDNNVAERTVRPLAIGRKNWLFFGNENGGEAASIIYSLVQTCRELGVNPQHYLEDVMKHLMDYPMNKLYELLPEQWALSKKVPLKKESGIICPDGIS